MVMLPSVLVSCGVVSWPVMSVSANAGPARSAATAAESINARLVKAYLSFCSRPVAHGAENWLGPFVSAAPLPWARPPRAVYLSRISQRCARVGKALRQLGFFGLGKEA